ncbi:FAD-dependent oxidoreductase [Sorangium sp. So ce1097]|uniref:FAD-dependent oxidoreductase n=1 Tax=Sorangium sp. So ce1097 TaxID=3133330 RepID=UPI003F619730
MASYEPPEQLLRTQVPKMSRVYVLGSYESRVTILSQQIRALNLIEDLDRDRPLSKQQVLVIGAGIAGLTAATAAAIYGAKVKLMDRRAGPLMTLEGSSTRWVHPHIFDWPEDGWGNPDANLPIFRWSASTVDRLVTAFREEWTRWKEELEIDARWNVSDISFPDEKLHARGVQVEWIEKKGQPKHGRFDAVILAVGFGEERRDAAHDFAPPLYWEADSLHQDKGAPTDPPRRILISGTGDGGLIDVLRARLTSFEYKDLITIAEQASSDVKKRLLDIEREVARGEVGAASHAASYLSSKYNRIRSGTDGALKRKLGKHNTVVLNGSEKAPFNLGSSILNRFLVARLLVVDEGLTTYIGDRLDEVQREGTRYRAKFKSGRTELFDEVVLRHGPRSPLEALLPSLHDKARTALGHLARRSLPEERFDRSKFRAARGAGTAAPPDPHEPGRSGSSSPDADADVEVTNTEATEAAEVTATPTTPIAPTTTATTSSAAPTTLNDPVLAMARERLQTRHLVLLQGPVGAGKRTLAHALAKEMAGQITEVAVERGTGRLTFRSLPGDEVLVIEEPFGRHELSPEWPRTVEDLVALAASASLSRKLLVTSTSTPLGELAEKLGALPSWIESVRIDIVEAEGDQFRLDLLASELEAHGISHDRAVSILSDHARLARGLRRRVHVVAFAAHAALDPQASVESLLSRMHEVMVRMALRTAIQSLPWHVEQPSAAAIIAAFLDAGGIDQDDRRALASIERANCAPITRMLDWLTRRRLLGDADRQKKQAIGPVIEALAMGLRRSPLEDRLSAVVKIARALVETGQSSRVRETVHKATTLLELSPEDVRGALWDLRSGMVRELLQIEPNRFSERFTSVAAFLHQSSSAEREPLELLARALTTTVKARRTRWLLPSEARIWAPPALSLTERHRISRSPEARELGLRYVRFALADRDFDLGSNTIADFFRSLGFTFGDAWIDALEQAVITRGKHARAITAALLEEPQTNPEILPLAEDVLREAWKNAERRWAEVAAPIERSMRDGADGPVDSDALEYYSEDIYSDVLDAFEGYVEMRRARQGYQWLLDGRHVEPPWTRAWRSAVQYEDDGAHEDELVALAARGDGAAILSVAGLLARRSDLVPRVFTPANIATLGWAAPQVLAALLARHWPARALTAIQAALAGLEPLHRLVVLALWSDVDAEERTALEAVVDPADASVGTALALIRHRHDGAPPPDVLFDDAVRGWLLRLLDVPLANVNLAAADALLMVAPETWTSLLSHRDADVRVSALGQSPASGDGIGMIVAACSDPDWRVRTAALSALRTRPVDLAEHRAALLASAHDRSHSVRNAWLSFVSEKRWGEANVAVARLLEDRYDESPSWENNFIVARRAAEVMNDLLPMSDEAAELLLAFIEKHRVKDEDAGVVHRAISILPEVPQALHGRAADAALILADGRTLPFLEDECEDLRVAAIFAITRLLSDNEMTRTTERIGMLSELATGGGRPAGFAAVSLGSLGEQVVDPRSVPALNDADGALLWSVGAFLEGRLAPLSEGTRAWLSGILVESPYRERFDALCTPAAAPDEVAPPEVVNIFRRWLEDAEIQQGGTRGSILRDILPEIAKTTEDGLLSITSGDEH